MPSKFAINSSNNIPNGFLRRFAKLNRVKPHWHIKIGDKAIFMCEKKKHEGNKGEIRERQTKLLPPSQYDQPVLRIPAAIPAIVTLSARSRSGLIVSLLR